MADNKDKKPSSPDPKEFKEINDLLAEQLNLSATLNDKMLNVVKTMKEKGTLDKLSLDLTKTVVNLTKNLKSEYDSVNAVQKDINKNQKALESITNQINALQKQGGETLKNELSNHQMLETSLAKAKQKIEDMNRAKALGKKIDEDLYKQAEAVLVKKEEQLKVATEQLSPEAQQIKLLNDSQKVLEGNIGTLNEQLRRQENINKAMGTLGRNAEGVGKVLGKLGAGGLAKVFTDIGAKSREAANELTQGGTKSLSTFGKLKVAAIGIGGALKAAFSPLSIITGVIGLFQKGMEKFKEYGEMGKAALIKSSEHATGLSRDLGISASKGAALASSAKSLGASMGMNGDMAVKAAGEIYGSLKGTETLSNSTMKAFMKLNVYAGISGDSLAEMHKFAKLTGDDSGKVVENMAATAQKTIVAEKVNVSMKSVLEGVAKSSASVKLNFAGQGDELVKTVIAAKKLGLEMSQIENIAKGLLNFEDSIAAEMEAELLTGRQLNLEKAREAALNNDIKGVTDELAKQGITQAEYTKMNAIQQEALAKSLGMSKDDMAKMLGDQKANKAENAGLVDQQKQSLAAMTSMASLAEKLVAQEDAKNASAAETGANYLKFQQILNDIAIKVMPIINALFGALFNDFIGPILTKISQWLTDSGAIEKAVGFIKVAFQTVKEIVDPIVSILGDLWKNILPGIEGIWNTISPVVMKIKDVIVDTLGTLKKLVSTLTGGNEKFSATEKVVISIAAVIGGMLLTYKAINLLSKENLALKAQEYGAIIRNAAATVKDFFKTIGSTIAKIYGTFAQIPFGLGIPLAIGAAALAGTAAYKFFNQGNDVVSPSTGGSGYGSRVLLGPEGAISFNNKDTIVAGTNLKFGGSGMTQMNDGVINYKAESDKIDKEIGDGPGGGEMKEMNKRLGDIRTILALIATGTADKDIKIDGVLIGKSIALGTSSVGKTT